MRLVMITVNSVIFVELISSSIITLNRGQFYQSIDDILHRVHGCNLGLSYMVYFFYDVIIVESAQV